MGEVELNVLDFKAGRSGSSGKPAVVADEPAAAGVFSAPDQRGRQLQGVRGAKGKALDL